MSNQEKKQNNGRKGGNKSVVIIGIIALVIIAVLVGVIVFLLKPQEEEKRNVIVTPENVEEVVEEVESEAAKFVPPGYFKVTMENVWHFASGDQISEDAIVVNVEENTHDVYFDIVLAEDEGHTIYKSPVIPRGGRLEQIALDEVLSAGTYDCVLIYYLVDEEQDVVSTLRVALTIVIEQ